MESFKGKYASSDGVFLIDSGAIKAVAYAAVNGSVIIPDSVTSIGDWTFSIFTGLTSVIIPASVTSIGSYAFSYCTSLTSITIPASVTSIGSYAFRNCTGLTSITVLPEVPPTGENGMFADTDNSLIYVPAGSADAYKSSQYWSDYADRIRTISE